MKLLVLIPLTVAAVAAAQTNCSVFNATANTPWSTGAQTQDHANGSHSYTATLTGRCTYSGSTPGQSCASSCTTSATATPSESGATTGGPTDIHNPEWDQFAGSANAPNGGATQCGVTLAVAVIQCPAHLCTAAITFTNTSPSGLSATPVYPVGSIFVRSTGTQTDCAAEVLPPSGGLTGCCADPSECSMHYVCDGDCDCEFASPIIVDTTGHGFHMTSAQEGVKFDFFGDGKIQQLSWTKADSGNGFLALDRNGNGRIDDAKELFGNITEQPPSNDPNGYLALAEFDKPENGGNGDGIIDYHDAVYSKLVIWIDANHDGISQPEELHSLPSMGVYSIGLKYHKETMIDQYGNEFRYRGVLNPSPIDGTSRDGRYTYDVYFESVKTGRPAAGNCPKKNKKKGPLNALVPADDGLLKDMLR